MPRFTLNPSRWYAMEWIEPDAGRSYSPIWLHALRPQGAGDGRLEIEFYHANYPEGVRDKIYPLRVLHRAPGYLLAEQTDGAPTERRLILIEPITAAWLRRHFPELRITSATESTLAAELDVLTCRARREF